MPRELPAYRDNLADILEFTGGRRLLSVSDVRDYTGLRDDRTIKRRFPFTAPPGGCPTISAPTLARCLSGGDPK